jgi:hypothetical protein
MEWSLHIATPEDLTRDASLPDELAAIFGNARFTRIAYGTEFCEHLLPSHDSVRAVVTVGRPLTFLTPYAGNEGIVQIRALLPELPPASEVVFNDWGVLRMLRREFPYLVPVQGRLLNKSLRDPRVTGIYAETAADQAASALKILQRSNLDNPEYLDLLGRFNVKAVEMDNLPQGTDTSFAARGVCVAVYLPFGFIATSRVCMAAGLHYRKSEKFQPGAPCRHECQSHQLEYTYSNSPFSNRDQKFLLKGNTYFYRQSDAMLRTLADQVQRGSISRLVYQPQLPMFFG